jgi:L-fuculose-phosphate aldolase
MTDLRDRIVEVARRLETLGLCLGTSGNVSARSGDHYLITPSGVRPKQLVAEAIVELALDGSHISGNLKASSEWPFHSAIYSGRIEAQAIVHIHSSYATAMACVHRGIPAFHYMVAIAGGNSIRCAPYSTFGSPALAGHVLEALRARNACLLANHGQVSFGGDLEAAFDLARWVEELSKQYWLALQVGEPKRLSNAEMAEVIEKFKTYGRQEESLSGRPE